MAVCLRKLNIVILLCYFLLFACLFVSLIAFYNSASMTVAIVIVVLLGYVFMASEHFTHVNKALVAMFCGTVGWILYMSSGSSFIDAMHRGEFLEFLNGREYSLRLSKEFIANHIFLRYVGQVGSLALYLLATMSIVVVLVNNECFTFVEKLLRRRNTTQMLWLTALTTFVFSTCIDDLTVTVLMLMIIRKLLRNQKQRRYIGAVVIIAATCGGCWTVIGDITSLIVWTKESVTATNFSLSLFLPAVVAMVVPTLLIRRQLPDRLDLDRPAYNFRGDDSVLEWWQKCILLFFGFFGLWFIPSFHRITLLPPFLGALCVLGVMWMLNEIINIKRIRTEQPQQVGLGRSLQYEVLQVIMYVVGLCLCVDVMIEAGAMQIASEWCDANIHNIYAFSVMMGAVSSVLDTIALVMAGVHLYDVHPEMLADIYQNSFVEDGQYWHLISLSGSVGGLLLPIGSVAGLALMRAEDVNLWWYARRISLFVLVGWVCSVTTYFLVDFFLRDGWSSINY